MRYEIKFSHKPRHENRGKFEGRFWSIWHRLLIAAPGWPPFESHFVNRLVLVHTRLHPISLRRHPAQKRPFFVLGNKAPQNPSQIINPPLTSRRRRVTHGRMPLVASNCSPVRILALPDGQQEVERLAGMHHGLLEGVLCPP